MNYDALERLSRYVKNERYQGFDVYDGLNSGFFFPFRRSKLAGIAIIQFHKRMPLNLRPLFFVPKGYNPKGLALFIKGLLYQKRTDEAEELAEELLKLKSKRPYPCWGYNFPWYAKAFIVPRWEPNMVTTAYVADALFDLYEKTKKERFLNLAIAAKDFFIKELILHEDKNTLCFGYIPGKDARVHNANLLGAMTIARIYSYTKDRRLKDIARKSVQYSIDAQDKDGSWQYGEMGHHRWIDNFHTGFNLCAIKRYMQYTGDESFQSNIRAGLMYHLKNHFEKDMTPRYYNTSLYPIDIHNYAQGIITMADFRMISKARKLAEKAIEEMQDKKGFFYFQKRRYYTIKIPYIRWSQAWMFYALSRLRYESSHNKRR